MSKKYPVFVEFSASGKLARIVHKNGKTVAILLCNPGYSNEDKNGNVLHHLTLAKQFQLIHEYKNVNPMELDVFVTDESEQIDLQTEKLVDRLSGKEITG